MNTVPYPKSVVIKCINCENEVESVDDDGYCEDCAIDIGITRQEVKHDID